VSREIIPKGVKGARGEEKFNGERTEKSEAEPNAEPQRKKERSFVRLITKAPDSG
jgi:hypothetical protein